MSADSQSGHTALAPVGSQDFADSSTVGRSPFPAVVVAAVAGKAVAACAAHYPRHSAAGTALVHLGSYLASVLSTDLQSVCKTKN